MPWIYVKTSVQPQQDIASVFRCSNPVAYHIKAFPVTWFCFFFRLYRFWLLFGCRHWIFYFRNVWLLSTNVLKKKLKRVSKHQRILFQGNEKNLAKGGEKVERQRKIREMREIKETRRTIYNPYIICRLSLPVRPTYIWVYYLLLPSWDINLNQIT